MESDIRKNKMRIVNRLKKMKETDMELKMLQYTEVPKLHYLPPEQMDGLQLAEQMLHKPDHVERKRKV